MKKNQVQFQKGMSLVEFLAHYGTEEKCQEVLHKARWPQGFRCPMCGAREYCKLKSRPVYPCNHCHHQTSLIAGTIFQAGKLPLTHLVSGHLPADPKQKLDLEPRDGPSAGN